VYLVTEIHTHFQAVEKRELLYLHTVHEESTQVWHISFCSSHRNSLSLHSLIKCRVNYCQHMLFESLLGNHGQKYKNMSNESKFLSSHHFQRKVLFI
jgi:hypothetical protein